MRSIRLNWTRYRGIRRLINLEAGLARPTPPLVNASAANGAIRQSNSARLSRRNRLVADAHTPQSAPDNGTVDPVAVDVHLIARRILHGKEAMIAADALCQRNYP